MHRSPVGRHSHPAKASQPAGTEYCMAHSNARREAYTGVSEAALLSLEICNVGAFVLVKAGAAPETPPLARRDGPSGVAGTLQSCRWTAGEPGRPGLVRTQPSWSGDRQLHQSSPGPSPGLHGAGSAQARTNHGRARTVPDSETTSPREAGSGVVAC